MFNGEQLLTSAPRKNMTQEYLNLIKQVFLNIGLIIVRIQHSYTIK